MKRFTNWIGLAVGIAGCLIAPLVTRPAHAEEKSITVVYVETNDPNPGKNAILAYNRADNGKLTLLGKFPTQGRGVGNPGQIIGPNDADHDVITSPDNKLLFAVNPGSNTIAVFRIHSDGFLKPVDGSPFPSGGINPVSLGLTGDILYVVNKNQDPAQPNTSRPNYTGFRVAGNGHLSAIPHSTVELPVGSSPTEALLSPEGDLMFGMQLFPGPLNGAGTPMDGAIDAFRIGNNGRLNRVPGTPLTVPSSSPPANAIAPFNLPLNGAVHPKLPILYVNFVTFTQIGVYIYGDSGELFFVGAVGNSGIAPCWDVVSHNARYMYTTNAFSNSVSTYTLANPLAPAQIQNLPLTPFTNLADPFAGPAGAFRLAIDPSDKFVYVLDQRISNNPMLPGGNVLHVLKVAGNGTLSEAAGSPITVPVPDNARPQGITVITLRDHDGHDDDDD